ncbi:hypothetical protein C8Q79DRAFT_512159 [Trametes meyenii]|nr:hypothetical protein C8Q79DRAFT_512159 [Trametes meyenii]
MFTFKSSRSGSSSGAGHATGTAPTPNQGRVGSSEGIDPRLRVGAIYLVLFIRMDFHPGANPSTPNAGTERTFHWGLYHHEHPTQGGHKYHIQNVGRGSSTGWVSDHKLTRGVMRSMLLAGVLRIGYCPPENAQDLFRIMQSWPLNQNPPGFPQLTCRTWTLHMIRTLSADPRQYVRCPDIFALENEAVQWGGHQWQGALGAHKPRPIEDSRVCLLN